MMTLTVLADLDTVVAFTLERASQNFSSIKNFDCRYEQYIAHDQLVVVHYWYRRSTCTLHAMYRPPGAGTISVR